MNSKLEALSLQDLVALEKIIVIICKKYENIANMNRYSNEEFGKTTFTKASNTLTHYNNEREKVLDEMERRIKELS